MTDRSDLVHSELLQSAWISEPFEVGFLAAGEYNENYLVSTANDRYVFRINHGTQLDLEHQIAYEFKVLRAVEPSKVTPAAYHVCETSPRFELGYLLMEYLPGRALDYMRDLDGAAACFAGIHSVPESAATDALIRQDHPVQDILDECARILAATPDYDSRTRDIIQAYQDVVVRPLADHDFSPDRPCITNTEVNSGNFVVEGSLVRLVDWEKSVWSYRYQDLGHFLVPTTTLWKSDFRFSPTDRQEFLQSYYRLARPPVTYEELDRHTRVLERTILLRAFCWVFMAIEEYELSERSLANKATYRTMKSYVAEIDSFLTPTNE